MSDGQPLKPRACAKVGCGLRATHFPVLILRPPRRMGDGESPCYLDLPLCSEHAATVGLKDLLTDHAWDGIVAGAKASGKAAPERGRTAVTAMPIDEAPALFRDRYEPAVRTTS